MKKDDFWFFSLVALMIFGINTDWPIALRIAVSLNSLLVLYQCISTLIAAYHQPKEDKKK